MRLRLALTLTALLGLLAIVLFSARQHTPHAGQWKAAQPASTTAATSADPLQPSAADQPNVSLSTTRPPEPASSSATKSTLRLDYERQPRDQSASEAEARVRQIYAAEPAARGILREVRCVSEVCLLDLRWSRQWNAPYNAALLELIQRFSRDLSIEANGTPDGLEVPIALLIRRPHKAGS
jgi:hypothetical protein